MIFIWILVLSALSISSVAAYFSIYGLASIFNASFIPVIIMGISLEIGKLVSASYVYKFWKDINILLKSYLVFAIIMLMFITSIGIFGFLSSAYQKDSIPLVQLSKQLSLLESEKEELSERKKQIDNDIASLPSNFVSGRERLLEKYGPEQRKITSRIDTINSEIHDFSMDQVTTESHVGPIKYIAKVFGLNVDNAIKYMILMLIFVFDPLAILLVISANIAIAKYKENATNTVIPVAPTIQKPIDNSTSNLNEESISVLNRVSSKQSIIDKVRKSS